MSEKQSVDDILSSIKNTVEQSASGQAAPAAADDVLDLTQQTAPADADDDMIDLGAFAAEAGVEQPAEQPAEAPAAEAAPAEEAVTEAGAEGDPQADAILADDDDFDIDSLMAEVAAEDEEIEEDPIDGAPSAVGEEDVDVDAILAETPETSDEPAPEAEAAPAEEAADEDDVDIDALMNEVEQETTAEEAAPEVEEAPAAAEVEPEPAPEPVEEAVTEAVTEKVTEVAATEIKHLSAVPGPSGLQVSFPVEVLAEALRPLVANWVEQNLPDIAERLIREELSKLAEK